ncbi:hypothetical protein CQW23_09626 [Capsicum baccatum]|uniref:DUF1985 domain-containing protein n=1 Tax=Capsicum baccatum TaxID=33114 RepID=A0A2G2WXI0_CAPBA|nr:hypothetical protein CQW23_09626 [Capsicum baccatum]
MYKEIDNDRDDIFVVNISGSELHFAEREFAAITGLKYGDESDFVEDFNTRSKLIDVYFNMTNQVNKAEFIRIFKVKNSETEKYLVNDEDVFMLP